jgi:hypothetical protein
MKRMQIHLLVTIGANWLFGIGHKDVSVPGLGGASRENMDGLIAQPAQVG